MALATETPVSLESGDHLTREEFHRRYSARPDIKKAELVEGVVYVRSPVRFDQHGWPHSLVVGWLVVYLARVPGLIMGDNATVFLDGGNEVQPDAFLWPAETGGAQLSEKGYVEGPPPLIVEVAASSVSYDLHEKKEAYRRNGVGEYVVWRVLDGALDWFELRDGEYVVREPDADGMIESVQSTDLRLHVPSLLAGNAAGVLAALGPPPTS
jgi:Uma2 family endonuclease